MDTCPDTATPAERFFFDHAGYRVGHRFEGAQDLASAEEWLKTVRHTFEWTPAEFEWDGDEPLPENCVHEDVLLTIRLNPCLCCGAAHTHTESLGSVAYMPGDTYPRVVQAELASQARDALSRS